MKKSEPSYTAPVSKTVCVIPSDCILTYSGTRYGGNGQAGYYDSNDDYDDGYDF